MSSKRKLAIIFAVIIGISIFTTIPFTQAVGYKKGLGSCGDISVTLLGTEPHAKGTKYKYQVQSGSRHSRIRFWFMKSSAFKHYKVVDSSEKVIQIRFLRRIFFPKVYRNDQTREVWFVLKHDYTPPLIDSIRYRVRITGRLCSGWVEGPILPTT
jgi:hypothetical protein